MQARVQAIFNLELKSPFNSILGVTGLKKMWKQKYEIKNDGFILKLHAKLFYVAR